MKKFAVIIFFAFMLIAQKGLCNAGTAVHAMETIQLDTIPIIQVNQHTMPKKIDDNKTNYIAPAINPADTSKQQDSEAANTVNPPSLNFNLGNIKNIKKGAILPKDNVDQNISNITKYYKAPYSKVFSHLLGIVDSSDFEVVSYDSASGRIFANYKGEKPVYITVSQYNSVNVLVKITPADGVYDIPASVTNKIFDELSRSVLTN